MTRPSEMLGEIVADLRAWRLEGATVSEMVSRLLEHGFDLLEITDYFKIAYCISGPINFLFLAPDTTELPKDPHLERLDSFVDPMIDETREQWMHAPPYPDLLR